MTEAQIDRTARYRLWLDAARTIAIVGVSAVVVWVLLTRNVSPAPGERTMVAGPLPPQQQPQPQPRPEPPVPNAPLSLAGAWLEGSNTAKVVLIEFSDFECPFCARFAQSALADVRSRYVKTGQVQVAFRHFPLTQIHPKAMGAAEAAECAGQQGKFWPMHDAIFADQARLDPADLLQKARSVGLDEGRFSRCLEAEDPKVRADVGTARSLDVTGTPTLFIGVRRADGDVDVKRRVTGAVPASQLAAVLDLVLAGQ